MAVPTCCWAVAHLPLLWSWDILVTTENKCWASWIHQLITHLFQAFPEQREQNEKPQPKVKAPPNPICVWISFLSSLSSFLHLHLHWNSFKISTLASGLYHTHSISRSAVYFLFPSSTRPSQIPATFYLPLTSLTFKALWFAPISSGMPFPGFAQVSWPWMYAANRFHRLPNPGCCWAPIHLFCFHSYKASRSSGFLPQSDSPAQTLVAAQSPSASYGIWKKTEFISSVSL